MRWKNIRTAYARHLKYQKQHSMKNSVQHKPYYLEQHLQFLSSHMKNCSDTIQQTNDTEKQTMLSTINEADIPYDYNTDLYVYTQAENLIEEEEVIEADISSTELPVIPKIHRNNSNPKEKKNKKEKDHKKCCKNGDADLDFLCSLLPDMRRMSVLQKLEFKINLLQEIKKIQQNENNSI